MTNESKMVEFEDGNKFWYLNEKLHREQGPAFEGPDGTKEWYLNGERHREQGPAVIRSNGSNEWWLNGQLHREQGPAIEHSDGSKEWWEYNELIYSTEMGEENPILKKAWESGSREEFNIVKALIS